MQFITITANDVEVLFPYKNIREKDLVGRENRFVAEGKVVLSVMLQNSNFVPESILLAENRVPNMRALLHETQPDCPIYCAPQPILDAVAGFHVHRGILAIGKKQKQPNLKQFLAHLFLKQNIINNQLSPTYEHDNYQSDRLKCGDNVNNDAKDTQLLVVLNNISNHDNVGSVFRNAAAFAADGVILDKFCCDPLYRKSIRVSVGAALKVPYMQGGTISDIASTLKDDGWQLIALSGQGKVNISDIAKRKKIALLLGSEGEGLPQELLQSTEAVRIPIAKDFDSLNIATACGIALSHFADTTKLR